MAFIAEPDRVHVGDLTYVATGEGWLSRVVVSGPVSRQGVGWALSAWMTADWVIEDLQMARSGAVALAKGCWCTHVGREVRSQGIRTNPR